jgi:quinoprotein glucose dehydrogenase
MINVLRRFCLAVMFAGLSVGIWGQSSRLPSTANGEWPHYTADIRGTRYSPLNQIDASNFNKLEVAWRFKTDMLGPRPEYKLEGTPLMINGVLYTTGGTRRSVVALDGKTGELIWAHSLREGKRAGIAPRQLSGRGVSYWTDGRGDDRFDRVTGQPVWPIEERPVPQSDVPGEKTSPTQPFPTKPPAYARNYLNAPDDLIDFTPDLRAQALENLERYKVGPWMYNPAVLGNVNGILGAINMGNAVGGTNWPGASYDPELHTVFAQANNTGVTSTSVVTPPQGFSDIRYVSGVAGRPFQEVLGPGDCCAADSPRAQAMAPPPPTPSPAAPAAAAAPAAGGGGGGGGGLTVDGLPLLKPPYGVLSAINLDRGEITWQVPHGDTPDNVRNHPALKGLNIPKTGQVATGGVGLMVTKTIVVMGDPQVTTTPEHPRGAMLRAYDKATGKEVGAVWLAAPQSGSPMTYMLDGRQYIVVAISGGNYSGEYVAFRLPGQ